VCVCGGGGVGGRFHFRRTKKNERFQWPRCLRRASAAVRLLGLRVQILPGAWTSLVSVVCCQAEVSETG
jgi:hypothetical protein